MNLRPFLDGLIVPLKTTTEAMPRNRPARTCVHDLNLHSRKPESFARVVTFHANQFRDPPSFRRADDEGNQVDGLRDQLRLRRHSRLLHQARKPRQHRFGGIRMYGGDATGMPGQPCLQERERFSAAHFADNDAVRAQPHGRAHQARDIGRFAGMELNEIFGAALDFEGVLDDHVALA